MSEVLRLATIGIDGMTCSSCSGTVENALKTARGVKSANINLTTNTALVSYDSLLSSVKKLVEEIESAGFEAEVLSDELAESTVSPMHQDKTAYYFLVLGIEGMTCSSCSGTVENALRSIGGVISSSVVVALTTNTATLRYDPSKVKAQQIANKVEDVGFGAELLQDGLHEDTTTNDDGSMSGTSNKINNHAERGVLKTILLLIEELPTASLNPPLPAKHKLNNGAHHRLFTGDLMHGFNLDSMRSFFFFFFLFFFFFFFFYISCCFVSSCSSNPLPSSFYPSTFQRIARNRPVTDSSDGAANITASLLALLHQDISRLDGVVSADLHASEAQIKITFDDFLAGPRDFADVCDRHGVQCTVSSLGGFMMANRLLKSQAKEAKILFSRLMLALALTVPIVSITMILGMISDFQPVLAYEIFPGLAVKGALLFLFSFPVEFYVGHQFHSKAYKTLKTGSLGMDFLVSTGTMAAYVYSTVSLVRGMIDREPNMRDVDYFETAAVLITAVLLGKYLEVYAKGQTAAAIHKLSKLKAHSARLVKSGTSASGRSDGSKKDPSVEKVATEKREEEEEEEEEERVIDASLLHRRDVVRLVAGETVPADGVILPGTRVGIDEAMMTVSSIIPCY